MDIGQISIKELIPQREPFMMVDKLTFYDGTTSTSEFLVKEDNIFCHEGRMSCTGMVENIAQTSGARIGYYNKFILGLPMKIGYIGSVRNMKIYGLPETGDTLETRIDVVEEIFNLTLINVRMEVKGKLLAEGQMKIALTEDNAIE